MTNQEIREKYVNTYAKVLDIVEKRQGKVSDAEYKVLVGAANEYRDWAILSSGLDLFPEVPTENK